MTSVVQIAQSCGAKGMLLEDAHSCVGAGPHGHPIEAILSRHATSAETAQPRIAILTKTFPKVTETFILGELLDLQHLAVPFRVYSLKNPSDTILHTTFQKLRAPVDYITRGFASRLVDHLLIAGRSPRKYAAALAFAARRVEEGRASEFWQAATLARLLLKHRIAHLHVHFAHEPTGVAEIASQLAGVPFSISAHAKDIYISRPEALRRKMQAASFTVTCTQHNFDHLSAIAAPGTALQRIYHGIDLDRFSPSQQLRQQTDSEPPLILAVGRLRAKKGFAHLIEACALLRDAGLAFRCKIVGYGPEHAALQAQINRENLNGHVELTGKLTHEQLIPLYARSHMFVLPCQITEDGDRDGVPNAMLEAMAMHVPVVSTSVSGIPEVIAHGENGLLVRPEDPRALGDMMKRLLTEPQTCERLAAKGRDAVARMFCGAENLQPVAAYLLSAAYAAERGDSVQA